MVEEKRENRGGDKSKKSWDEVGKKGRKTWNLLGFLV